MLFLVLDVKLVYGNLGLAHCKCPVTRLPFESVRQLLRIVGPFRRLCFDPSQHVRHSHCWTKSRENMDVVRHSTNLDQVTLFAPNDSTDVGIKFVLERIENSVASVLGAEYDVIGKAGKCAHR